MGTKNGHHRNCDVPKDHCSNNTEHSTLLSSILPTDRSSERFSDDDLSTKALPFSVSNFSAHSNSLRSVESSEKSTHPHTTQLALPFRFVWLRFFRPPERSRAGIAKRLRGEKTTTIH